MAGLAVEHYREKQAQLAEAGFPYWDIQSSCLLAFMLMDKRQGAVHNYEASQL
jgi:hypothetical protein